MKFITRFFLIALLISLIIQFKFKINFFIPLIMLIILFGVFIVCISFHQAINQKTTEKSFIKEYENLIEKFK
ncbi:hypothetical protein A0H76_2217 [Hepatospora eriocheir]|uniref:Uncharacterized protein n=1 Tax=Hepatospora eriocheir TaxID=1081669 RepID=A0A1X0QFS1_9MICR|nr:hypothetical protein A0H76_2217 [Hepatospora eriocheir]